MIRSYCKRFISGPGHWTTEGPENTQRVHCADWHRLRSSAMFVHPLGKRLVARSVDVDRQQTHQQHQQYLTSGVAQLVTGHGGERGGGEECEQRPDSTLAIGRDSRCPVPSALG